MYYITPTQIRKIFICLILVAQGKGSFIISMKMVVLLKICVETLIHFFSGFFDG